MYDIHRLFGILTSAAVLAGVPMIVTGIINLTVPRHDLDYAAWTRARGAVAAGLLTVMIMPIYWLVAFVIWGGSEAGATSPDIPWPYLGCGLAIETAALAVGVRARMKHRRAAYTVPAQDRPGTSS